MHDSAGVCVVLLNWNGWRDTVECLESVLRSDYPNFRVVVCDNASSDGSLERIKAWADGTLAAGAATPAFDRLRGTALARPLRYIELDRAAAERDRAETGADADSETAALTLIATGANLGFAGGNNVGLRHALADPRNEYFWLLNNDTVIEADALRRLVEHLRADPGAGICGSTLRHYYAPQRVQALGGSSYRALRCRAMPVGADQPAAAAIDGAAVERQLAYVNGASMMLSRSFLRDVGLMAEDYFLYYEEFDWARRAAGRYRLAYAPLSVVYHKEGGSIGTAGRGKISAVALYYLQRNRIKFMRRFYAARLPLLYLNMLLEMARALLRRDFFEIKWSLIAMLGLPPSGLNHQKRAP
ncbi:glycosyltransferase family 2 protein [Rugamonas sp.]|uniref:glycosyltransferase family 2 protein n=1 Tax=Rugamonas sp. TaxID=1926287 RepID=UPI0025D6D8C0|nr:glycosyltransferase family 2 protein [Rugamonas sp.]